MNGEPNFNYEKRNEPSVPADERMFDPLSPALRAKFDAKDFDGILKEIDTISSQQDQRNLVRAFVLATTEAMTKVHAFKVAAASDQEAMGHQEEYDRLKGFYENLMKISESVEE